MIGKVYLSIVDYYNVKTGRTERKSRPVLVIGGPRNNDYTVLPISTISKRQNVDPKFDVLVDPSSRSVLMLNRECFIRTHKQMPLHQASLYKELSNMKDSLPDLYLQAISLMEEYQQNLLDNAF